MTAAPGPLSLRLLEDRLAIWRLDAGASAPAWTSLGDGFVSITRTAEETSVVCAESRVPPDARAERGFRALQVPGPLDFSLTGVLASLLVPLAEASVPVFAVSTHDSDFVLVRQEDLSRACDALRGAGHAVDPDDGTARPAAPGTGGTW